MTTVTFSDLIQLGILIVGIIALCKKRSNKTKPPNIAFDGFVQIHLHYLAEPPCKNGKKAMKTHKS